MGPRELIPSQFKGSPAFILKFQLAFLTSHIRPNWPKLAGFSKVDACAVTSSGFLLIDGNRVVTETPSRVDLMELNAHPYFTGISNLLDDSSDKAATLPAFIYNGKGLTEANFGQLATAMKQRVRCTVDLTRNTFPNCGVIGEIKGIVKLTLAHCQVHTIEALLILPFLEELYLKFVARSH